MKWSDWNTMSMHSQRGAFAAAHADVRSAVNRHYYSAFQAVTAFLLYSGLQPPKVMGVAREAWSHAETPKLFRECLSRFEPDKKWRSEMMSKLRKLYNFRIHADYIGGTVFRNQDLEFAKRDAGMIIKTVQRFLPRSST